MRKLLIISLVVHGIVLVSFYTPKKIHAQTNLSFSNIQLSSTNVRLYEKQEVTFEVSGTVAKNLQWPCDVNQTTPTVGSGVLPTAVGITVDGVFQNGQETFRQPAFLYTPYTFLESTDFYHPNGEPIWMVRFAPRKIGNWSFHLEVKDGPGCARFYQSGIYTFNATPALGANHGFVGVSQTDRRYFEFSDRTAFIAAGHASSADGTVGQIRSMFTSFKQNGVNFVRIWMDQALVWGRGIHQWDIWSGADVRRTGSQKYGSSDLSIQLANNQAIAQPDGGQYHNSSLEANTTYKVRLRAKLVNVTGIAGNGLQVVIPGNTSVAFIGNDTNFRVYEGQFTNTQRINLDGLALRMVNAGSGIAYIDELYIGKVLNAGTPASLEDLSSGLEANVVFKGKMNYHQYFDEAAAQKWDRTIDLARQNDVYLKLVVSDQRDTLIRCINPTTGLFGTSCDDDYFFSSRNGKVRRLQEYFWRYLTARWGYAASVHSWELNNEGSPCSSVHFDNADHMAEFFQVNDPNRHMATTSFWSDIPELLGCSFFNDPATNVDYADFHAYQSPDSNSGANTGWLQGSAWNYLTNDTADYHFQYAKSSRSYITRAMPIIRGEGGLTENGPYNGEEQRSVYQDRNGVWLHNFLWAWVNEYAVYELYWWNGAIDQNNLRFQYKPFSDFMIGVPISNGRYEAVNAQVSAANVRLFGQKNSKGSPATQAVTWIHNKNHTWNNAVSGSVTGKLGGTVTISGFLPNTSFPVEWWDFVTSGTYTIRNTIITSSSTGNIVLNLDSLPQAITDTAVKIGDFSQALPTPPPTPNYKMLLSNWLSLTGDQNGDGKINVVDFGWLL